MKCFLCKGNVTNLSDTFQKIEEVEPDDWDKAMIKEIETDPDCKEFVSESDALKELGLE